MDESVASDEKQGYREKSRRSLEEGMVLSVIKEGLYRPHLKLLK
ncbi:hypothetical protein JCM19239_7218 [Vibrio variabilis]|uniref:Uncharacterized protein n=1 Tax=Vibrio variabilis TaxID=990271 RepID=A0ABQ0J775_9VIBR|nr:hypothetical protein JCM19239_7218 [Vibrio variabilis]